MQDTITDVAGIRVGHDTNAEVGTGCTVILCDTPAVGGVDITGGQAVTREIALLYPMTFAEEVHAILLTGGSAFGLDAASGVMRYLAERNIGTDTGVARVPLVPAAAIFDLSFGSVVRFHPDAAAGYRACERATTEPVAQGNVGAGTGATVGKLTGFVSAMKGGLGSASAQVSDGTIVGALVVVNALGDVIDPQTQQVIAGTRNPAGSNFPASHPLSNTTLAVIATNASLSKEGINKVAQMARNGMAQVIRPVNTLFDGDTVFALALGPRSQRLLDPTSAAVQVNTLGTVAATTLARAIIKAVRSATDLHGVPAARK